MPHKLKITITHRILNTMKKNIFNLINNTTNRKKQNTQQINLYKIKQYNPKIIHANSIKQYFLIITRTILQRKSKQLFVNINSIYDALHI